MNNENEGISTKENPKEIITELFFGFPIGLGVLMVCYCVVKMFGLDIVDVDIGDMLGWLGISLSFIALFLPSAFLIAGIGVITKVLFSTIYKKFSENKKINK